MKMEKVEQGAGKTAQNDGLLTFPSPKVTVVTVTYNALDFVEETLQSVLSQTYPDIEYIVVDGHSTDGTQESVARYADRLAVFISEPDNGIYDAMNKGIDLATGEWIIFMNAGDTFADHETVSKVFAREIDSSIDFIYGDHIWKDDRRSVRVRTRPLHLMWQRIAFSHQSLFSRTSLMKRKKFDLRYRIVSDYNFYFSCYMEGSRFLRVDFPVSVFLAGGVSNECLFRRTYERWSVVRRYKNTPRVHLYYLFHISAFYLKKIMTGR
ncbi:MAG: glycosyltransferase family 2 protein [Desulfobulbaceae bacterium]